jgi:hypothetical protein
MEETIYLKVDTGMQMSHTTKNFLGREDNFLHSTPKLVVIRKDKTSTCFKPPHHSIKDKIFQTFRSGD